MYRESKLMSVDGFDQILEQLMHATGPQGTIPATDAVIEGLPRFKLDEAAIGEYPVSIKLIHQPKVLSRIVPCARTITYRMTR